MSIFVEDNDVVEVSVHYIENKGIIELLDDPTDKTTTLKVVFRRPDFSISQRLMSSSTTTDASGNQTVNWVVLQNNLIYFLAKSWDAKKADGSPMELNNENISKLRVEIARGLVSKAMPVIGQIL
jgi:uncharacterized membrane protein